MSSLKLRKWYDLLIAQSVNDRRMWNYYQLATLRHIILLLITLIFVFSCSPDEFEVKPLPSQEQLSDIDIVSSRIASSLMQENLDAQNVSTYINTISNTGEWDDIDYRSGTSEASTHLDRLLSITIQYCNNSSTYYLSEVVFDIIERGLQRWYDINPTFTNWWWVNIGVPQRLGKILLLLKNIDNQINNILFDKILNRWESEGGDPQDWAGDGANQVDVALHWLYRGCLLENDSIVDYAISNLYAPIVYDEIAGFQSDGSFFQHGPQFYVGGYGEVLLTAVSNIAVTARGTKYQISKEKLDILSVFVRDVFSNLIRGRVMAFNCHGRSVSRKDQLDKTYLSSFYSSMSKIDEQYSEVYNNVAKRFLKSDITLFDYPIYNKYFYKGDYMMHVRSNYSIFVRTSSKRTVRNEYGNDENIKGYFISDGSTCINVTGEEYYNIMPLWDWTKLPGTTAPYIDFVPLQEKAWSTYGTSEMCGGVSDSRYGAVMYKYYDSWSSINTGASKGYFMFDKEIVCLGAGLNSDKQYQTNINQCYGRGDITVYHSDDGGREIHHNNTCLNANNIKAIYHNNIGYIIPEQQDIYIRQSIKDGNWNEINKSEKDSTITDCIFQVGIDHSVSDTSGEARYIYMLVPGLTLPQFDSYLNNNNINVISNTEEVQAVENTEIGVIQALFYSCASVWTGRYLITASAPCCLMIQYMDNNKLSVYASEPTQQNNLIDIDITDIKSNACKRENFAFENDGKTIHKIFDLNM